MAHRFKLVIAASVALLAGSASAGYAQLAPPDGFTVSNGTFTYKPSANDAVFDRVVHQPNALKVPVPGTATKMPAAYRLAANAPRIAAGAIFMSPHLRTAVAIAGWLVTAKVVWDEATKTWKETRPPGTETGLEYNIEEDKWFSTPEAACSNYIAFLNRTHVYKGWFAQGTSPLCMAQNPNGSRAYVNYNTRPSESTACPPGWTTSPAGCLSPALDRPSFERRLLPEGQPWPMPEGVPTEIEHPLPVDAPVINPAPGSNPQPRPLFVPTGDPVKNPDYDPDMPPSPTNRRWMQPGVRVTPSPTPTDPWRVDLQPVNRPVETAEPLPDPVTDTPESSDPDKPKTDEQQSLCEKHPDVVACAKLGTAPEAEPVPNEDRQLSIQPDTGWGEGGGSCPAPKTVQVHGFQLAMPFDLLCDFAAGIRPVVIGLAWLAAAFTFMGLGRRD